MPLVYQQNINAVTRLGVWHIQESEDFFLKHVPLFNAITHPHKRLQHLAGRMILKELYEHFPLRLIQVADTRKPFLPGEEFHFSISHCGDYAAAIVSKQNRVGVDIEIPQAKIAAIKNKFLKPNEQQLLKDIPVHEIKSLTIGWSAKEAIFKWYAAGKVDFKEHIHLHSCNWQDGEFKVEASFTKEKSPLMNIHGLFFNENCLCWVCT